MQSPDDVWGHLMLQAHPAVRGMFMLTYLCDDKCGDAVLIR